MINSAQLKFRLEFIMALISNNMHAVHTDYQVQVYSNFGHNKHDLGEKFGGQEKLSIQPLHTRMVRHR